VLSCELCGSDELKLVEMMADGRRRIGCVSCGHQWVRGEARPVKQMSSLFADVKKRFPGAENVDPDRLAQVEVLKAAFLERNPESRPEVGPYWDHYRTIFTREGLRTCKPQDLKDFATNDIGTRPGNVSVFNKAWDSMGPMKAAVKTRDTIQYLLYGPEHVPLEDRLTHLINADRGYGMTGFKEAMLTRVLCVNQPDRFLPILTYSSSKGGKKEIAQQVYGLELPEAAKAQWTIGRLILWSNDVLLQLVGDGFAHTPHAAQFLWEIKDRKVALT
jgi:hypothetical protein